MYHVEVPLSELAAYVHASKVALRAHAQEQGDPGPPEGAIIWAYSTAHNLGKASNAPALQAGRAQLCIWWLSPPENADGPVLWEVIEVPEISRAELASVLEGCARDLATPHLEIADEEVPWTERPPLPAKPALWHYHPERLRRLMPYGEPLGRCGLRHKGAPTTALLNDVQEIFRRSDQEMLGRFPLRRRTERPRETARALLRYTAILVAYASYCGSGRQLFDIPPQLTEMFTHTDVDEVHWENVKLPYPCIYLHFGPQAGLDFGKGWLAEGAYIQEVADGGTKHINMCVVAAPPSMDAYMEVDVTVPPCYSLGLGPQHMGMALGEAVDLVLSEKLALLKDESEREPLQAEVEKAAREQGVPPGVKVVSVQRKRAREELAIMAPRHEIYLAMLRLVVNSLCYLTAYPEDIQTRWPARTPPHELRALERAGKNRNERQKALNRLAALGYSPVNLCGRNLVAELEKQRASEPPVGDVRFIATHWVRGHWKRQPFGPGRSQRKLQWRMPRMRRSSLGGSNEAEPLGHIYLAG